MYILYIVGVRVVIRVLSGGYGVDSTFNNISVISWCPVSNEGYVYDYYTTSLSVTCVVDRKHIICDCTDDCSIDFLQTNSKLYNKKMCDHCLVMFILFYRKNKKDKLWIGQGLLCLTPLSTIFQLQCGVQFYWWRKQPTCRKSLANIST